MAKKLSNTQVTIALLKKATTKEELIQAAIKAEEHKFHLEQARQRKAQTIADRRLEGYDVSIAAIETALKETYKTHSKLFA